MMCRLFSIGLVGAVVVGLASCAGEESTSTASESWTCDVVSESCDDVPTGQTCPSQCEQADWIPGECTQGTGDRQELLGRMHIALPDEIEYTTNPPATGDHRPMWACWGEYSFLPATRWLHNLEHGGIAFLYNPCAPESIIDELRDAARRFPGDETGPFRWVMTPYANLPSAVAVVAWEWVYQANCVQPNEISEFVRQHYRQAPEDIAVPGTFSEGYLGN